MVIFSNMEKGQRESWRIALSCPDKRGVVAKVSACLAELGATILEAQQHSDEVSGHFFMRYEVTQDEAASQVSHWPQHHLERGLTDLKRELQLDMRISSLTDKPRIALLATKASHCLVDVLQRWRSGELPCDIACVIANHPQMGEYAGWYDVPFHHVDFKGQSKAEAFKEVDALLDGHGVSLTVLARFMQIIPPELIDKHPGRIINIHHSFLPSFIGARPYHQAAERGVKQIGATCHYVTSELDAGPIIEQDVHRVTHHNTTADMVRLGKDVEKAVLSRGLRYHIEDRVLVHGNKTVVFA